ncbi:MAG: hypothetical protein RL885_19765 [Planctomycetota bacterium]
MSLLTVPDLRELIQRKPQGPCVSLYQPTTRTPSGSEEARIRFDNLIRRAGELLEKRPAREVGPLLDQISALSSKEFWNHQLEGLAVFGSAEGVREYRLPHTLPELVVVADSFHVRPLLRSLQADRQYFLLELSEKHTRFCRGSAHGLRAEDIPGLPASLVDALGPERGEPQLQQHTGGRSVTAGENTVGEGTVFHGHEADLPSEEDVLRYLRAVDAALFDTLHEEKVPLILCCPERYHPAFRSVARYPHLMEEGIRGNFETAHTDELHERAWPIVEKTLSTSRDLALEKYGNRISKGRSSDELGAVARATIEGRIDTLLLAEGRHEWGDLDRQSGEIRLRDEQRDDHDDDILDDLAEMVILRGGEVFTLEPSAMPSKSPVAATFRW